MLLGAQATAGSAGRKAEPARDAQRIGKDAVALQLAAIETGAIGSGASRSSPRAMSSLRRRTRPAAFSHDSQSSTQSSTPGNVNPAGGRRSLTLGSRHGDLLARAVSHKGGFDRRLASLLHLGTAFAEKGLRMPVRRRGRHHGGLNEERAR